MNKVFVGNLDFSTTRQNLEALFSPLGQIVDLALPVERDTARPRGFAFITFESQDAADEAIRQLDGTELLGRSLRVTRATPKPAREDRGSSSSSPRFRPGPPPEYSRPKGSRRGLRGRKRSL